MFHQTVVNISSANRLSLYLVPLGVRRNLEVLPAAAPPPPRELSETELANLRSEEENTLRELRLFLRQITWKLLADRKFKEFSKPVDPEEVRMCFSSILEPCCQAEIAIHFEMHYVFYGISC